ncbi:diguanylate cyclase response regulator [Simiduia sp. 21SJ11W-1]|uniref:GGDEF domain-containing response regulator n=1 Tax=Simiduia sp. 21SJ11W-1 TaxID=2909669 RepID=UPI00209C8104|nr:diguanylate cyclase response regulator [Simiduia sp. 21SJ11W-1]UTA47516.1 diguanylate cyclase response regulator [Simiduia sp. 21SJ11W-1]
MPAKSSDKQGLHILHVEDSEDHQLIMRSLLNKTGLTFKLTQCQHRDEVKQQLASNPPFDLVLLDYLLADGTSENMLGWFTGVPVVVVTVMEDEHIDSKLMQKGAADFVSKGELTPNILKRVIRHALDRQDILNQLIEESWHDSLTGLYNRRFAMRELNRLITELNRYGSTFSCALIDMDELKQLNDNHGHPLGDAAIKHIAHAMTSVLRDGDLAARLGGDEFLMVFPKTDPKDARQCLLRFTEFLAQHPVQHESKKITLSVSCGLVPSAGESPQQLLKKADALLYQAKGEGKNRISCQM